MFLKFLELFFCNYILPPDPGGGSLLDDPTPDPSPDPDPTPDPGPVLPDFMKDWNLDASISKEESLLNFKNPADLAKSYIEAKKFVGADKMKIPGKYTTDEEWREIYTKFGLPETAEKYDISTKDDAPMDKEFLGSFLGEAHKVGLLPKQAQAMVDFYNSKLDASVKSMTDDANQKYETNKSALQEEWGTAFDPNMASAKSVMNEHGGEGIVEHLKSLGVDSDAKILSMLSKVGYALAGDNSPGIKDGDNGAMTPKDAMEQMDAIRGDGKSPYYDAFHPEHKNVMDKMQRLSKFAYPNEQHIEKEKED